MLELIPTIATSFATAMATNAFSNAQGPAQALDDLMALSGFEKLHLYAEKKRASTELNIQSYKEAIAQEIIKIPKENIQEPQMSIVGPALEASKYYIEEEEIREMFAKIVAGSMNSRKSPVIHHSFVEVIKQLNKDDAVFLNEFSHTNSIPSLKLFFTNKDEQAREFDESEDSETTLGFKKIQFPDLNKILSVPYMDVFYCSSKCENINKNIFILSNLVRLGIVNFKELTFVDKEKYRFQINKFEEFKQNSFLIDDLNYLNSKHNDIFTLEYKLTTIELTPFGNSFCKACL